MKKILVSIFLMCVAPLSFSQGRGVQYIYYNPNGNPCNSSTYPVTVYIPSGALYTCQNGSVASASGSGSFVTLSGDATSTATGGATEVVGLLNHLLPSLTTGYLNWTGSAWALSAGGGGDTITSPNSTISVGGTSSNTTIDLAGSAGEIMAGATPALTYTPTFGKSGTAGTLAMFPSSGNFTTTLGSAATASNTVNFFASVPTTGDLVDCITSSTTCTLTDSGVLAANVVNASSPGVGIAHFAGSTQTVTSSTIATGDVAANAITLAKLATQAANTVLANVTGGSAVPTAAAIPSGMQFYTAGTGYSTVTGAQWLSGAGNQTANTVLGALTATTPSDLAVPSCSSASNALTWTSGTGFGCNTISGSGTVNSGTANHLAYYASSTTAVSSDSTAIDNGTTFTYSGTGGVTASAGPLTAGNPAAGVGSSLFMTQCGTVPSGFSTAGQANIYCDSTQNGLLSNFNAGTTLPLVQGPASDTSGHVASFSGANGGKIVDGTAVAANLVVAASPGTGLCHFAGSTQTCTSSAVVGGDMTNNTVTATQLAAQYSKWSCETGLGDGLNAVPAATYLQTFCYNTTGVTVTLTGLKCYIDGGSSSTMNAAGNALGALLTGAITCSTSFAGGTQSANVALTSGDYIKFTFVADGTAKQTTWVVTGTY